MKRTLSATGQFYKGNIHMHSTHSDGHYDPAALKAEYKKHGYSFFALTDHNRFTHFQELSDPGFLVIPGVEGNAKKPEGEIREYHFVVLPGPEHIRNAATLPPFEHMQELERIADTRVETLQAYIDDCVARGYMVMTCHPYWSTMEYDDILPLTNLFAVEVYNHCSEVVENMGHSEVVWDALSRRGMKLWGAAVDDNHNVDPFESHKNDACGGFVMVKADALTIESICDALYSGSFYASTGPVVEDFYVEDGEAVLRCAPANTVFFIGDLRQRGYDCLPEGQNGITEFRWKLRPHQKYVRAEVYTADRKRAWTNPIWL